MWRTEFVRNVHKAFSLTVDALQSVVQFMFYIILPVNLVHINGVSVFSQFNFWYIYVVFYLPNVAENCFMCKY